MIKKVLFSTIFMICMAAFAVTFTSCSDDDDPCSYYKVSIGEMNFSGSTENMADFRSDIQIAEKALCDAFDIKSLDANIKFCGDEDECDDLAMLKFNRACENVTLHGGWSGNFSYRITRIYPEPQMTIAEKSFDSPDTQKTNVYTIQLIESNVSGDGISIANFNADLELVKQELYNAFDTKDGSFTLKGNTTDCNKSVTDNFNSVANAIQVNRNWKGYFTYAIVNVASSDSNPLVKKKFTGKQ